jgi:hypothetical protein
MLGMDSRDVTTKQADQLYQPLARGVARGRKSLTSSAESAITNRHDCN